MTGCFAQTDPEAAAAIAGVDLVVGNQEKYRLPELLGALTKRARPEVAVADIGGAREIPTAPLARVAGRSRGFVKIQDGCQHRCAFCIVPTARGRSRSQEPQVVRDQVLALVAGGYLDVTLTGVDIGHYGWDLEPTHHAGRAAPGARGRWTGSAGCGSPRCCRPTSRPSCSTR